MTEAPGLSAVTVGVRGTESLRGVLAALRRQTAAKRIELVAVIPPHADPPPMDGLGAVRIAELRDGDTTGYAIARGVWAASAPTVAYVEEHSWPEPDWAERVLAAHDGSRAAVAWSMKNANPDSTTSWTHLIIDFGAAVHPASSGDCKTLPWHHTSYRRDALLAYGEELGEMLEAEWRIHADLRARGEVLYLEASAHSRHWNVSQPPVQLATEARGARVFGASRVVHERWSALRRAAYALAAPLIYLLRLRMSAADVRRVRPPRLARVSAMIALSVGVSTAAEVTGYLAGFGRARETRSPAELDRAAFLSRADRAQWDSELSPQEAGGRASTSST